ncbi:MAG: DNA repair protein RadA, partial [Gammaproteobacteria bacterium]
MARVKVRYRCSACGAEFPKWAGQCADCGAWNTLTETLAASAATRRHGGYAGVAGRGVQTLSEVTPEETVRTPTGLTELDR